MRKGKLPKTLKTRLDAMLPTALGVLVDLLACKDTRIRTEAQALWRASGLQLVQELDRRKLRH